MTQAYPHPAAMPTEQLLEQCDIRRLRRSGPGGQHRNKVETAVVIHHRPSDCSAEANEKRSQDRNRKEAIHRLRLRLAIAVRTSANHATPSATWQQYATGGKIKLSLNHADYPALLAEALDQLHECQGDHQQAAQFFGLSGSQLLKFVARYYDAHELLNRWRVAAGMRPINP